MTTESLDKLVIEKDEIDVSSRRDFLKIAGIVSGGAAIGLNPFADSEAEAQAFRNKALLYDIRLSSLPMYADRAFDRRKVADERRRLLALLNPRLRPFLKLDDTKTRHNFYLDIKTIAQHADRIVAGTRQSGINGTYKQQKPVNYNPNRTQGIFANVLVDRDIGTTVRELSTAYTPRDVQATTSALVQEVYRGRLPRSGDLARFQVRFLKFALRTGMKEGIDYFAYTLQPRQTLNNFISTYTQGDYGKNTDAVLKFNSIEPYEINSLSAGTMILVPSEIHKNPLQPTVVAEKTPGKYVIVPAPKPKDPVETSAETAEREAVKTESIPEIGESANSYIDDVIAQNLMVLGQTEMPAVLTEAFNMKNNAQINFYRNDGNLRRLAESYGRGILGYLRANPHVTKVITDNGHGQGDPGAPNQNNTLYEGDFTGKMQNYLSEFLKKERASAGRKFEVLPLDYTGGGGQLARLNWYVNQANRINNIVNGNDDSIYVSIHINSARASFEPPPEVRIHGRGSQPKSTELGAHILSFAVPWYQSNFKSR